MLSQIEEIMVVLKAEISIVGNTLGTSGIL